MRQLRYSMVVNYTTGMFECQPRGIYTQYRVFDRQMNLYEWKSKTWVIENKAEIDNLLVKNGMLFFKNV